MDNQAYEAHRVERATLPVPTVTRVQPRMLLGLYLLFLAVYLASTSGHFLSVDHIEMYLTTQSLVEDGDLAIKHVANTRPGPDGRIYSSYGVGQAVLSIPLYRLGALVERSSPPAVQRYFAGPVREDYAGTVPIFFVSLFNAFVTPLCCLLICLFCVQMGFSIRVAVATTLIFGLSTQAWVQAREYFQHPLEMLTLLASVYVLFAHRQQLRPRHTLLAGSAMALGILTRTNLLLLVPVLGVYVLLVANPWPNASLTQWRLFGQRLIARSRHIAVFLAPIALSIGITLYLNTIKYGPLFTFGPQVAPGFSTPLWEGLYGYLVSPGRSIFLYSPPIVLTLVVFQDFYRQHRLEALLFGAIIAIYLVIYARYSIWYGGWSFGPRYLLATLPYFVIPLAYCFERVSARRALFLLAALGIGIQVLGVVVNYHDIYLSWLEAQRADDSFLFVPRLSAIPAHWRALRAGRYIDVWLVEVYQRFPLPIFVATVIVPLMLLALALALLRPLRSPGSA